MSVFLLNSKRREERREFKSISPPFLLYSIRYLDLLESHYYRNDIETRYKVYIFNVLEDSVNNWVPRRKDFDPKTLAQL